MSKFKALKAGLTTSRILKYGAVGTAGAAAGAYLGAFTSGDPQFRGELAANAAMKAAIGGAVVTTGFLLRKPLGAFTKGAMKGGAKGLAQYTKQQGAVVFRRIRGRIIPIKVK